MAEILKLENPIVILTEQYFQRHLLDSVNMSIMQAKMCIKWTKKLKYLPSGPRDYLKTSEELGQKSKVK